MTASSSSLPAPPGAPRGNENRVRHGVFSWATSGKVPTSIKGGTHLRNVLRAFRSGLLVEVERVKGRPATLHEQALISSAVRHEGRARLLERLVADDWARMLNPERIAALKEIGSASDSRDKALKAIGLDTAGKPADPWERMQEIFGQAQQQLAQQAPEIAAQTQRVPPASPRVIPSSTTQTGAALDGREGGAE